MINFKELEKFATSGKVATIVVLVDGKELFALSFQMDTLAYKEILEDAKHIEKVAIPDKTVVSAEVKKAETERKESLKAKKGAKTTPAAKIEPEPLDKGGDGLSDDDDNDGDFGNDDDVNEDIEKGPKESFVEKAEKELGKEMVAGQEKVIMAGSPTKMTRAEIMAQEEFEQSKQPEVLAGMPAKQVDLFAKPEVIIGANNPNKAPTNVISEEW